ncbi:hypothetical protein AMTR_s00040p00204380 [Amborella trichopoda]|uniref:Uncharacterized protein n=1 Tax=Amborella trichopoda TaxID=13333 RepID=W1PZY8_AMBTC|nr:hypothetical protein AMTR_s00040p00204380 [Amborella trichopoda]
MVLNCLALLPQSPTTFKPSFISHHPIPCLRFSVPQIRNLNQRRNRRNVVVFAEDNGVEEEKRNGDENGGKRLKGDEGPRFQLRWRELLDPDPQNILAVGLTGLLTWASVQVLWQLFFISLAILVAALKYSLIAALLLFILITLL